MMTATNSGPFDLWCATTAAALAKIAHLSWRRWPDDEELRLTRSQDAATAAARELARVHGAGHVVRLALKTEPSVADSEGLASISARRRLINLLEHAITEYAHYCGAVPDAEIHAAEAALAQRIPVDWRRYLLGPCWFHRGWMRTGAYVWLYPPSESVELSEIFQIPGMFVLGGSGGSERIVIDLRDATGRVSLANVVCADWSEALPQAPSLESFLSRVDAGTFEFSFS